MHPVAEEDHRKTAIRIDPDRGAGEAGVADAPAGEPGAGRAPGLRGSIPAERPVAAGRQLLSPREGADDAAQLRRSTASVLTGAGVTLRGVVWPAGPLGQHPVGEHEQVSCRTEQARMARDALEPRGILVVHLAPDDPAPPGIVLRW